MQKICILGLGYIGLPTAAMFATHGKEVIGVDVNQRVVDILNNGEIHIHEPGLQEQVRVALASGNLRIVNQPEPADAFIIAVPTPFQEEIAQTEAGVEYKKADMRYVVSATEAILPHLQPGNLVVLESTSPPRTTTDLIQPILERNGLKAGQDFSLAYSPERVLPGKILKELVENARVIGGVDSVSAAVGKALYTSFVQGDIFMTDATTAEMTKLMENTCRDVNIALANEFSRLAERVGFDVWEAIALANHHPRVNILNPGPGVGGHCISVDPWFLVEKAPDLTKLIHQARTTNDAQPAYIVELVKQAFNNSLVNKRIAALGLAYKPDVDDLRESPAIEVANLLASEGASVIAFEPYNLSARFDSFETANSLEDALFGVDGIIILVAHQPFHSLKPKKITRMTTARIIIDTVHCLHQGEWEKAGFSISQLGN